MNAALHPTLAAAMLPMAPPSSIVHQIVSDEQAQRMDAGVLADKLAGGYDRRGDAAAMRLQLRRQGQPGSRL